MHHPLILYFLDTVFIILQNAPSLIKVLFVSHSLAFVWPCSHDYSPLGIWHISRYWRHHYQSPTLKRCHRLLSISVTQHCDQKQLRTKWFSWFTSPDHSDGGKPGQEPKVETCRQGLRQRSWRNAAYWLPPCGLLSLLPIQLRTIYPEVMPLTEGWFLPHQPEIKEKTYLFEDSNSSNHK